MIFIVMSFVYIDHHKTYTEGNNKKNEVIELIKLLNKRFSQDERINIDDLTESEQESLKDILVIYGIDRGPNLDLTLKRFKEISFERYWLLELFGNNDNPYALLSTEDNYVIVKVRWARD